MKKPVLVYVTYVRTTPKKLWTAITNPVFTRRYWGGFSNHSDWKKGSAWRHLSGGKDAELMVGGKVLESTPPKRLVLSWVSPDDSSDRSKVSFEIQPLGSMVCLTVTHDAFSAGSTMPRKVSWGWPRVLSSMKSYLETGKGLNIWAGR